MELKNQLKLDLTDITAPRDQQRPRVYQYAGMPALSSSLRTGNSGRNTFSSMDSNRD